MKGRILNIVLVVVLATLPMTADAGWSEAKQETPPAVEAPQAAAILTVGDPTEHSGAPNAEIAAVLASAIQVAAGLGHTCALTNVGGVKCWGRNFYGQLGDGTTWNRYTPVDVSGLSSGVVAIAVGYEHTCAVTSGGGAKCWGRNHFGELGDGTWISRYTPVDVSGLNNGVITVATSHEHTCAVMSGGGLKCWGSNYFGELGDGTTVTRLTPVNVSGLSSGVKSVAAGSGHTCAVMDVIHNGRVKCWGGNWNGSLGDGTFIERHTPVDVSGLDSGATMVSAGGGHTCVVMDEVHGGGVKCWGLNGSGELGDGTTVTRNMPVDVSGLSNGVRSVATGWHHTCALTSERGIKCWGSNTVGQLGDGTTVNRYLPVAVNGLGNGVMAVSPGGGHTCALTTGGEIKCWGSNNVGQLGDGTTTNRLTPGYVMGFGSGASITSIPLVVPANSSSTANITLSGAPPGHRVQFNSSLPGSTFAQRTGTVDSNGRRTTTLRSSTPGTAVITVRNLTTGQTFPISTRVTFNATQGWTQPPPANTGPVGFTRIRAQHPLDGRYLQNVPVPNRVEVTVDWKGSTPGRVEFILNGVVHSVTTSGTTASRSFDMGRDLRAGNNTLRIVAINAAGQRSQPWDFAPSSTSQPVWMTGLLTGGLASLPVLATGGWNGQSGYEMGFHLPPYAFDILAPGFGVPDGETKLSWEFSGKLAYPLFCAGPLEGSLTLGAERGFRFLGTKIEGKLVGSVTAEPIGLCAWEIPHGTGTLKFEATRNIYRKPVIVMVAYFNATLGVFVERTIVLLNLQTLATKILGEFYIDGKARVEVETDVAFRNSTPYFQFSNLSVGGGIGIEGGYRYQGQIAEIKVWAGANGMVRFSRAGPLAWPPTGNWTFQSITLTGEAGAKFRAGWFEREAKGSISWTYPRSSFAISEGLHDVVVSDWRLISHISTEDYSVFQTQPTALQAFAPQPVQDAFFDLSTTSTVTSVLVSNVYTYTEPSLAVNPVNDTALLLWVHDDIAKAVGQSHEIAYSRWNGSAWSVPAMVTNDNRLDGAPQTAWAGNGQGVAVWQRLEATLPITATFDITTAKKLEIATATFNPVANTWSPVALLTNNTALDMAPALARRTDGGVLAVWRQNAAGLLSGDYANPDRIMTARYNNGWTTPVVAVDNIPGLVDLAAGYGANAATIAYTRFITPTGSVTPTLQLFASTWNGTAWSPSTQLTGDMLNHTNPRAVYTIANQPLMIWQAGSELRLRNLATGSQATLSLPASIGDIDEFRIVQDHAGNIAAVFTAQASQRDMYVAFYDLIHGLWGLPKTLTQDTWSEGYPTPALDATGRLLMAYAATEIVPITRTTTITSTGQVITYTLPLEGQTDLVTLSHVFVRNLTLTGDDLAISDQHPTPGTIVTISATVRNTGDLALGGVSVAFYDGDPQAGGSLINTTTLPQPLAAGYTATLTTLYTIPTTGGGRAIHAVADPQNQIAESNENDNEASLAAFGPDLALDNAAVDPWGDSDVGLVTWVQNIGTTASPTTTVAFYWETITGTLATADVLPSIAAGAAFTLTTPWNHGNLPVGEYRLVSVVNPDTTGFYEVNTENNQAPLTLRVGPDLMVSPYYLWLTSTVASTTVITAAVYNVGSTPSPVATASFYPGDPTIPGNLIFSRTVPALAPAGVAYLTGTWSNAPSGIQSVTVWIDPAQAIVETSRANNLASGMVTVQSNLTFRTMLPLIVRTR